MVAEAAAVLAVLAPASPPAEECRTRECSRRVASARCSQRRTRSCIHLAALRWNVSQAMLRRKASCETGGTFSPYLVNSTPVGLEHAAGLFQFLPSTWGSTPYRRHWIFSARYSALAAGWMHHVGRGIEWACA
jgi:hypothetical protein